MDGASGGMADLTTMAVGQDYEEIRDGVRKVCADFPGEYWREKDEKSLYPHEFVDTMTKAGYLGALIPEEYGGAGLPLRAASVILEEIHASGCSATCRSSRRAARALTGRAARPRERREQEQIRHAGSSRRSAQSLHAHRTVALARRLALAEARGRTSSQTYPASSCARSTST